MVLGLVLAGCAAPDPGSFRDVDTPISSTTRFSAQGMLGDWVVTHRFAAADDPTLTLPESFRFADGAGGVIVRHDHANCNDWECVALSDEGLGLNITGPGRFALKRKGRVVEHWVLWVDEGFRTAAIGTPSGAFGWIMARETAAGRSDLQAAAREVLEWQGYDLNQLRKVHR